jgi:hypothetical protein
MPSLQVTGQLYLYHMTMLFIGKGKGQYNLKVKLSLCHKSTGAYTGIA